MFNIIELKNAFLTNDIDLFKTLLGRYNAEGQFMVENEAREALNNVTFELLGGECEGNILHFIVSQTDPFVKEFSQIFIKFLKNNFDIDADQEIDSFFGKLSVYKLAAEMNNFEAMSALNDEKILVTEGDYESSRDQAVEEIVFQEDVRHVDIEDNNLNLLAPADNHTGNVYIVGQDQVEYVSPDELDAAIEFLENANAQFFLY